MAESSITSMMDEKRVFNPPKELAKKAYIKSMDEYKKIYKRSVDDPEGFWGEMAQTIGLVQESGIKFWSKILPRPSMSWFIGGKINVSNNCVDRHCKTWRRNKAAIIWQGEPE